MSQNFCILLVIKDLGWVSHSLYSFTLLLLRVLCFCWLVLIVLNCIGSINVDVDFFCCYRYVTIFWFMPSFDWWFVFRAYLIHIHDKQNCMHGRNKLRLALYKPNSHNMLNVFVVQVVLHFSIFNSRSHFSFSSFLNAPQSWIYNAMVIRYSTYLLCLK